MRLSTQEKCALIERNLRIEKSCMRPSDSGDDRICCLVHKLWLERLSARGDGTANNWTPPRHPGSAHEQQLVLQPSHSGPVQPWLRISINVLQKPVEQVRISSSCQRDETNDSLTIAEHLQTIGLLNHVHSCETAVDRYPHATGFTLPHGHPQAAQQDTVSHTLSEVYGVEITRLFTGAESLPSQAEDPLGVLDILGQNVVPFVCALESAEAYFLVEPYFQHSLKDVVTFSPAVLSQSNVRSLFIVYQLLHALNWYHNQGMSLATIGLHHVKVHRGLWLYLQKGEWSSPKPLPSRLGSGSSTELLEENTSASSGISEKVSDSSEAELSSLVNLWVQGCMSNFDYLTALNRFAGRHLGDPNYHPVFPWVTDFTDPAGGYRNLRKSKYRLNKGDRQLDVTYKAAYHDNQDPAGAASVPHHVSDVLSDITYHVYLARITSKAVLCEHVRTQWVPNEYPSSMERLYQWTPDECIPQYFSDPTIFTSIHTDLPDMELPSWASTPADFIQWHRQVLECDAVSNNLHHWIDLTFGYKLSGKAAVKAKNVCLHLADKHRHIINHGVVQLFTEQHPSKSTSPSHYGFVGLLNSNNLLELKRTDIDVIQASYAGPSSPSDSRSQFEDSLLSTDSRSESVCIGRMASVSEDSHETRKAMPSAGGDADVTVEEKIVLPENYNPLELLERFEAVQKFGGQFERVRGGASEESKSREKSETGEVAFKRLVRLDMECLGCLLVEMLIPEKSRLITSNLKQSDKKKVIVSLCTANPKILPRFVRSGVLALLNAEQDTNGHLPLPTAALLLQPVGLFPFPAYFRPLHEFLAKFYYEDLQAQSHGNTGERLDASTCAHLNCALREGQECSTVQVTCAVQFIPLLLPELDNEGVELLLYHLQPLFECTKTRLYAFIQLFELLAQALGPKATVRTFMKPLMNLFDSYSPEDYEHLVSQSFLSQIIVRFGLENFLDHFVNSVVDAVAFKSLTEKHDILVADRTAGQGGGDSVDHPGADVKEEEQDTGSQDISSYSNEDDDNVISISTDGFQADDFDKQYHSSTDAAEDEHTDQVPFNDISGRVSLMPSQETEEYEDDNIFEEFASSGQGGETVTPTFDHDGHEWQQGVDTLNGEPNMEEEGCKLEGQEMGTKKEKLEVQWSAEEERISDKKTDRGGEEEEEEEQGGRVVGRVHTAESADATEERMDDATKSRGRVEGGIAGEYAIAETDVEGKEMGYQTKETGDETKEVREGEEEQEQEKVQDGSEEDKEDDESDDVSTGSEKEGDDGDEEGKEDEEEEKGDGDGDGEEQKESFADFASDSTNRNTSGSFADGCSSPNIDISPFFQDSDADAPLNANGHPRMKEELTPGVISGIAADSVVWLAPRLGPVLTSKYIASQLLGLLAHCYIGEVAFDEDEQDLNDKNAKWVLYCLGNFCALYGDAFMLYQFLPHAERTVKWIKNRITAKSEAAMAGILALLKYCLPYMSQDSLVLNFDTFFQSVFLPMFRILSSRTLSFPGGAVSRAALCNSYVDLLTALCLKLERDLAREFMTAPLQQFFSCFELIHLKTKELRLAEVSFIAGTDEETSNQTAEDVSHDKEDGKQNATGGEMDDATEHVDALYKTSVFEELYHTFSAGMAHHAFVPICAIMGEKHMETALVNHDLIWNLCCSHDPQLSHLSCEDEPVGDKDDADGNHEGKTEPVKPPVAPTEEENKTKKEIVDGGDKKHDETTPVYDAEELRGKDVIAGTRPDVGTEAREMEKENEGFFRPRGKSKAQMWFSARKMTKTEDVKSGSPTMTSSSDQYLRGSWLEHWRHQLDPKRNAERSFNIQKVKLQTFTGHNGSVRSLYVQDSEHFFLSSSKDKTVKLWSLSNHGDGTAQSASSWTYYRHSHPVFAVTVVESLRRAVSCDGSVHLWDPVSGSCLGVVETTRSNPVVAMTSMPAPSQCVVTAMLEGTARFLDVRQSRFVQEWKVTTSNVAGSVRDMCSSPDGLWVAIGFSSGLVSVLDVRGGLLRSQRRAHTSDVLQVKAFSNNSFVTSSVDHGLFLWKDDGHRLRKLRGQTDHLHSLAIVRDHILSTSIANRVGVHNLQEDNSELTGYSSYKVGGDVLKGNVTCMSYLPLNQLLLLGSDTSNIVLLA